jgi:Domain of unknown function (DUF4349)
MRASDSVESERLARLLRGAAAETEHEARVQGLLRELRSQATPASQALRERVRDLQAAPSKGRERSIPRRVVLAAVALAFVAAATLMWAAARPAADPRAREAVRPAADEDAREAGTPSTREVSAAGQTEASSGGGSVGGYAESVEGARTPSLAQGGLSTAKLPATGNAGRARDVDMSLELRVRDADEVSDAANETMRLTRELGGYVVSSSLDARGQEGRANLDLRVPVGRVEDAVVRLSGLGTITEQRVALRDLQTAVDRRARRIAALERAIRVDDLRVSSGTLTPQERLEVEIRLEYERASLNRARTERRHLLRDASVAELALSLHTREAPTGREEKGAFARAVRSGLDFLAGAGSVTLFALIVTGPLLLVVLAVWLAFRARARRLEQRLLDRPQPASAPPQAPSA